MFYENKKAFSLIELLVVISVISLLMAILIPVSVSARRQGYCIACKSNLRQLILANTGYATENDGFYVAAASDMWLPVGFMHGGLHRWHGVRKSGNEPFDPLKGPLAAYLADGKVKECPERVGFIKDPAVSFEQGCGGYGYNMVYIGSRTWRGGSSFEEIYGLTARMSEISKPDSTLIFADTGFNQNGSLIEYSFAEPYFWIRRGRLQKTHPSPSIHFRHAGYANIGWCDGHVDSRLKADCEDSDAYNADFDHMNLGWFEPLDNSLFDLE
jgi:prepilin-type N-terminal cleavage/methylation domain-containing protein/prepilin-type processing-associated H-X9-DG protein